MAIPYETALAEDFNLGYGTAVVDSPQGGTLTGHKIGIHTFYGLPMVNPSDFSGTDAGAKIQAAHDALNAVSGIGVIDCRGLSGASTASATITLSYNVIMLLPKALTLQGAPGINITADDAKIMGDGFGSVLTGTSGKVAIQVGSQRAHVTSCRIDGGSVGIDVVGSAGENTFRDLFLRNQTTAYIRFGDVGLETTLADIDCATSTGTTTTGILVSRTTSTDTGALYMRNVRVVQQTGGTITTGFNFTSSVASTGLPVLMDQCVADGITADGIKFKNLVGAQLIDSTWVSMQDGSNYPVTVDACGEFYWRGGRVASESSGTNGCFLLQGGTSICRIDGVEPINGPIIHFGTGSPAATTVHLTDSEPRGTNPAYANNLSSLNTASATDSKFGLTVYTEPGGTDDNNTFTIRANAGGTPKKRFYVSAGTLTITSDAGTAIYLLDDTGNIYPRADGTFIIGKIGSNPIIQTDTNDLYLYDRSANDHQFYVGGNRLLSVNATAVSPGTTGQLLGTNAAQWRVYHQVIATASLPAAGASMDGAIIIENAGAGDQNVIIYANAQRFRIDGGTAF